MHPKPLPFSIALAAAIALAMPHPHARPSRFVAGYHIPGKYLVLSSDVRGEDDRVKPFDQLTQRQIADIYHEAWHAYFILCETPSDDRPQGGPLYQAFRKEIGERYAEYPADKHMEIHEEAVADYLDALTETYVQMKRHLGAKTPRVREAIRRRPLTYFRCWEDLFQDFYRGYYTQRIRAGEAPAVSPRDATTTASEKTTLESAPGKVEIVDARDALADFIQSARAFGMPAGYIEKAAERLNGVAFIEFGGPLREIEVDLVWSKWDLPQSHRRLIERILLEGKFPRKAHDAFAEERFRAPSPDPASPQPTPGAGR